MASFADWNLAVGIFTATMTLLVVALGAMTIRRIVGEEREERLLQTHLLRQDKDTRRLLARLDHAPFAALSRQANRLRQLGIHPPPTDETGDDDLHLAYLEAEAHYSPFDPPVAVRDDIARRRASGQGYDPAKTDPETTARALREYTGILRVMRDLYEATWHVSRHNRAVVALVDSHNLRMQSLRRGILATGIGYLLLVGLPLGLVAAVPTRRLAFHFVDASISLFTARVLLLTLFVATVALGTTLFYLAARRLTIDSPPLHSIARCRDPRAFDPRFEVQDLRRRARLQMAARVSDGAPHTEAYVPGPEADLPAPSRPSGPTATGIGAGPLGRPL